MTAQKAARALQAVLDDYAGARPPELRQERVTAKQAKRAENDKEVGLSKQRAGGDLDK